MQAESQIHLAGLTSQERKYHHVVLGLSPAAGDEVNISLAHSVATTPFDQIKANFLQQTAVSVRYRLQQIYLQRVCWATAVIQSC